MVAISGIASELFNSGRKLHADLLDDWSIHYAFESIRPEVVRAYRQLFEHASTVSANSEATLELARSYGRSDAVLITNGCDPERFDTRSRARGLPTVGYVGKIGRRLDLELIERTATELPLVSFVFAGPILDKEYRLPLERLPNVKLLGDVHYESVPQLLTTFDVGWVPHRVGAGEVGGDVIKTYEYRAANLPVLTTPIIGIRERALEGVWIHERDQHSQVLNAALRDGRVARIPGGIPAEHTWSLKASELLNMLGLVPSE
jgi:glycosyltransferase involved in cell wall biosynthesis